MNAKRLCFSHRWSLPMAALAIVLVAAVGAAALEPGLAGPVTNSFTYQGRLAADGGDPVNASCDFQFALWDDPGAGSRVGPLLNPTAVVVADGLFTEPLDFGEVFEGTALWLEVAVKCTGDADYTTLAPRQALTAAPYANYALSAQIAGLLDGYDGGYYLDATHINTGTLSAGYYSAYDDLGVEGYFDNNEGDLARNKNVLQPALNADLLDSYDGSYYLDVTHVNTDTLGPGYYSAYDDLGVEGYLGDGEGDLARNNSTLQPTLNADMLDSYHASDLPVPGHDHWGEAWTGTGTGLNLYGGDTGIYSSAVGWGIYGQASMTAMVGVYGKSTATTGSGNGVRGESQSSSGRGIYGIAPSTTGTTYGVYGESQSSSGTGVYGLAAAGSGTTYGVYGLAQAADGYAVGTHGKSDSSNGRGVVGYAPSGTGDTMGVHGRSASNAGIGVHGWATSSYGMTTGTHGRSDSSDGFGVVGHNWWNGVGVGAWSYGGNLVEAYSGDWPGGILRFYITNNGTVYADGGYNAFKSAGSDGNSEYRTLYGMTSAEAWTEDFGRATLVSGRVTVAIDPAFAQMVNLATGYHVYLTPICIDLVVLGVTDQQPDRFTVQGATLDGTPSGCAFDYRIVAKQRGHEDERLEAVDIPEPVAVDQQENHVPGVPEREWEDG